MPWPRTLKARWRHDLQGTDGAAGGFLERRAGGRTPRDGGSSHSRLREVRGVRRDLQADHAPGRGAAQVRLAAGRVRSTPAVGPRQPPGRTGETRVGLLHYELA